MTVNGGNEYSALSLTVSNTDQKGYVPNTGFKRTNISVGGNTTLDNGFNVGGTVSYIKTNQKAVQSGVGASGSNNQSAFARALYLGRNWDVQGQPYQNPVDMGSEFMVGRGQADNPYWSYQNVGFRDNVDRIIANVHIGYDITEWLNVSYKLGYDTYNERQKDFIRPGSTGAEGVGRVTNYDIASEQLESNLLITFTKKLTEDLSLRAILGQNVNQRTEDAQAVQGKTYVVFNIDDLDNTNNVVPDGGDYSRRRLWGVYADLNLGYKDWAFLGLTGRNDWSSTLPVSNRSYFYPAITGSLILNQALGWDSGIISSMKLRGAWSQVGNDTDPYLLRPIYLINDTYNTSPQPTADLPFTPTGGSTIPGATLSDQERDPDLKPERTRKLKPERIFIYLTTGLVSISLIIISFPRIRLRR